MKKSLLKSSLLAVGIAFFTAANVGAVTVNIFEVGADDTLIDNWFTNTVSVDPDNQVIVDVYDFDSPSATGWLDSYSADGLGTFTIPDSAQAGSGSSAHPTDTKFRVLSRENYYGRSGLDYNNPTDVTVQNNYYLDSADVTEISLNLETEKFTNLFFYMTDPSDVKATTSVSSLNPDAKDSISSRQGNADLFFVGVTLSNEEILDGTYLSQILWDTGGYSNDGWGVDLFHTVQATPVPEPATMLLFGAGLAGLAGSRLRKEKK